MSFVQTLNLKAGNTASFTTDAQTSGTYLRVDPLHATGYSSVTVSVSTSYTLGPYNEDRIYQFSLSGNALSFTLAAAAVSTNVVTAYASDGAVAFTAPKNMIVLTKGSAGAYTLAAPIAGEEDGKMIHASAGTAYAHVITATGLIGDGVTGGYKDTLTFGAYVGSGCTLMAYNGKWLVLSKNVVTVA